MKSEGLFEGTLAIVSLLFLSHTHLTFSQSTNGGCQQGSLATALVAYDECLRGIMDQLFKGKQTPTETLANYLQHFCESTMEQKLNVCQDSLQRSLTVCMNDRQRGLLEVLKKSNRQGIYYLCQDSGRRLTGFREADGNNCLGETVYNQKLCVDKYPLLSMYIDDYSGDFCTIYQPQGFLCLKEVIKASSCSSQSAEFLINYYQAMVDATPCSSCMIKATGFVTLLICFIVISFNQKNF